METTPLRYNISSWDQLVQCLSNYSDKLHLKVKHILQDNRLNGTVIQIDHEEFGTLFCYLADASGPLLGSDYELDFELTTKEILKELERFGFFVTFNKREHLADNQVEYLKTVKGLGFDKIRILDVYSYTNSGAKLLNPHVVVFNIQPNPGWLDITYSASKDEYTAALAAGTAVDLSAISEVNKFHWDWLDYVASIDDILAEYDE